MADSDAVRSRRKRQHAQGDHSICKHDRPVIVLPEPPGTSPSEGEFDPEAELRRLADLLAEAYRQDPGNAALARELRATLPGPPPGARGPGRDRPPAGAVPDPARRSGPGGRDAVDA